MSLTRRELILLGFAAACASADPPEKLRVRPNTRRSIGPGLHALELERRALLYVPQNSRAFALVLHGANGSPDRMIERLGSQADEFGVILLAPKSEGMTWDAIRRRFGPDILFLNNALGAAFARCSFDPKLLAVSGFSDGATYALAIGLANGDLFSHIAAFSPGFLIPVQRLGTPRFFLSHGTHDDVLPIDHASRPIARDLGRMNLSVKLREFDGGHILPPEIVREAFQWLSG
ncbi:MAG: hypothetical protein DMF58_05825 [Acidobacteria bacterium]|nr:MAG: hypothetical protein DMF58_05825 [Acidobacteriota bacterium]